MEPWLVAAALCGLALCACTSNGSADARQAPGRAPGPAVSSTSPSADRLPTPTPGEVASTRADTNAAAGAVREPASEAAPEPAREDIALVARTRAVRGRSAAGTPLELRIAVRNDTDRTLELLLWNTPFEETLSADLFTVTRDGERVPFGGRLVKRAGPPPVGAYRDLAPGERLERTLDLSRNYPLDRPGTYRIRLVPPPVAADGGPVRLVGDGREIVVERFER